MQYFLTILDTISGCYSFDTIFVEIKNINDFEVEGSLYICEGSSSTLTVIDDFEHYLWSTSEITKSITISEAGTYSIRVTDSEGCIGFKTINVLPLESEFFKIIAPTNICAGGSETLRTDGVFMRYL